ncbi:nSTAND1 domain-containing NTPase [Nonomuraea antri]|uniref:nSTAND1 domain-containing NTPase n=1 Tax=Nonomuraea antri TaxID=2730852 RepID=UPI001C2BE4BA|nr:hypothetical protein [Nonomuraea antri]
MDPTDGPIARFAYELRKLRQEAGGPTYRVMAGRAHYSAATLAQAAAGERLPSLAVALAYAAACGGDAEDWRRRWHEAVQEERDRAAAEGESSSPYLGLARFEPGDSELFFGREEMIERLAALVREHRVTVLVGPSGGGKSSLLRAGLVPRLSDGRARSVRILTPGPHPLRTCGELSADVLVVDQFEEVYALCDDPGERAAFIDALLAATRDDDGRRLVLALRADFFSHCAEHPELAAAIRESTLLLSPMTAAELREAIVRPAASAGLIVERDLTAAIVAEIQGEPCGLPLMAHALLETWRRRHGRALTLAAYQAAGGLHAAIARTSEELYDELSPDEQVALRHLLLRMVTPGQGAQDTRRPVDRAELAAAERGGTTEVLLERLAQARLITIDETTVDLAHEALLTAWPRLSAWIEEDRERLRLHRRLTEAANAWHDHQRDPGSLYRGVRLSLALEAFDASGALTPLERDFLDTSAAGLDRERRQRTRRRTAMSLLLTLTLVAAVLAWQQHQAGQERRRESEARRLVGVAESLRRTDPVTAMRLGLAARHVADLPETRSALLAALTQKEQDSFTDPDGDAGTMRHLSADGRTLVSIGAGQVTGWDVATHRRTLSFPALGAAMEYVGWRKGDAWVVPLIDTRRRVNLWDLRTGALRPGVLGHVAAGAEMGTSGRSIIGYSPRGSAYRVRMWDTGSARTLFDVEIPSKARPTELISWPFTTQSEVLRQEREKRGNALPAAPDAAASPDDRLLAVCVPGEPLQLWDVPSGRRTSTPWAPRVTVEQCLNEYVHFTPDSRRIALITDERLRLWDLESGRELTPVEHPGLHDLGFSADGRYLAATDGSDLLLWRTEDPERPVFRYPLSGERASDLRVDPAAGWIRYLAGPDGAWGDTVRTLRLGAATDPGWRLAATESALFSPDGTTLVTAHRQSPTRIGFQVRETRAVGAAPVSPEAECRRAPEPPVTGCDALLAFSSDGRTLAYAVGEPRGPGFSQQVSLWDVTGRRQKDTFVITGRGDDLVGSLAFGPGDTSLVVASIPVVGDTRVWDLRRRAVVADIPDSPSRSLALRPGGTLLVGSEGKVIDLASGRTMPGAGKTTALAFSRDGTYLAAGDSSGRTVLWDGAIRRRLGVLSTGTTGRLGPFEAPLVTALAFSPDGRVLAVGDATGSLQLWDTASRRPIGTPLPTPGDIILALAFSPDGETVYSVGQHTPLRAHDLRPGAAEAEVCRRAGGGLTPEQWASHLPGLPYERVC